MNYADWIATVPKELTEDSLLTLVPQQRGQTLHDDTITYWFEGAVDFNDFAQNPESPNLINNVPLR
ncbi:MAG TPA: hypothetical protein P5186_17165 [Candidatus Paceibacterota bacterium]|nr:hypothetical protein [Candidatus Paceibacterota bacterium]HRZ99461.1 hypothetical protein [Candidatus Paceibacterota bacterium]